MSVEVIRSARLGAMPHGFLGRRGGVSVGELAGLNVGTGSSDDRAAIAENRRRALAAVAPAARLATVHQVHSAEAVYVTEPSALDDRPRADAMATDRRGVALGILTADCAPVLFADPYAGVIGAAHAGWRGALAGVTEATIAAMEALGARRERIAAAVGPCIAQASYEVDAAFRDRFGEERWFIDARAGKSRFDLPGYVAERLRQAGIGAVDTLALDTYAEPDRFFSYRRATLRAEADFGRQLSLIALP